jgi:hypothetical protein
MLVVDIGVTRPKVVISWIIITTCKAVHHSRSVASAQIQTTVW